MFKCNIMKYSIQHIIRNFELFRMIQYIFSISRLGILHDTGLFIRMGKIESPNVQ